MTADFIIFSQETDCAKYKASNTSQICLVGNRKDSCAGDSGGPAYPLSGGNNKPICLYGVISFGSQKCKGWGVYTRVSYYSDWIKNNMS